MKMKQVVMNDVTLINNLTGESVVGDILGQDNIDGKIFWIVKAGQRAFKLSKEGHDIKRNNQKKHG